MSRRSTAQDVTSRSILPSRPLASEALPKKGVPWSCVVIGLVNLLAIVLLLVLMGKMGRDLASAKRDTVAARTDAAAARKSADSTAGLVQSIGQAIATLQANGTLTPEQAAAIAAGVVANQAARSGTQAQAGTTPGIPGSRSGGGTSVTPGVPGSATAKPVASQTTPPPHSSDTSKCLLTVDVAQVLKLDGTVCPH